MTDDKEQIQSLYVAMYKAMMAKDTLALGNTGIEVSRICVGCMSNGI